MNFIWLIIALGIGLFFVWRTQEKTKKELRDYEENKTNENESIHKDR